MFKHAFSCIRLINKPMFSLSLNKKLTDWEYLQKINQDFKNKNTNRAVSNIIESYLQGVILDKQFYFEAFTKLKELQADVSYQEIAYILYRESFSPCLLMKPWMQLLVETGNNKLYELLEKDFTKLNLQMPKRKKIGRRVLSQAQKESRKTNQFIVPVDQQIYKQQGQKMGRKIAGNKFKIPLKQESLRLPKKDHIINITFQNSVIQFKNDSEEGVNNFAADTEENDQFEYQMSQQQIKIYLIEELSKNISKIKIGKLSINIIPGNDSDKK